MKNLQIFSMKRTIAACVPLLALSMTVTAVDVNLMSQDFTTDGGTITVTQSILPGSNVNYRMGFIGGALFRRAEATDDTGSGGGTFRNLYDVQPPGSRKDDPAWSNGYNRNNAGDASVPGGFAEASRLTRGQLRSTSDGYHVFAIDVNESNSATLRFISLDSFKIYAGGEWTDTADNKGVFDGIVQADEVVEMWGDNPLPQTTRGNTSELDAYVTSGAGRLIYDMDAIEDSTVFIDYSSGTGSGTMDFFVFVPVSMFDGVADNEMIYVFTEFGSFGFNRDASLNFEVEAGGETIGAWSGAFLGDDITTNIPEPGTSLLSALGGLLLLGRRSRA